MSHPHSEKSSSADASASPPATDGEAFGKERLLAPRTVAEVQEILRRAAQAHAPVAVHVAPRSGVTRLCLSRLNRIVEVNTADLLARVEAGVRLGDLQAALRPQRLRFVPARPPFHGARTVGELYGAGLGNVASLKYGPAKHFLLGSRVVLAGGELLATGGRTVKNVTGYDLTRFLNAPLAAFGVPVEYVLKLHPEAPARRELAVRFPGAEALLRSTAAMREARLVPEYLVWIDPECQRMLRGDRGAATHLVLLALDGLAEEVAEQAEAAAALFRREGAVEVLEPPAAPLELERWADLFEPGEDLVLANEIKVDQGRLAAFLQGFGETMRARGIRAGLFGQIAEGNLSVRAELRGRSRPDLAEVLAGSARAAGGRPLGRSARASGRAPAGPLAELETTLRRLLDPAGILEG
jgi:glycolate oxidase